MDQTPTPQNVTETPVQSLDTQPVVPPVLPEKSRTDTKLIFFAIAGCLGLVICLLLFFRSKPKPASELPSQPQISVTPTPIRTPAPYASDSAFLKLESDIVSFVTSTKDIQLTDPAIASPVITVPLGFSK